MNTDWSELKMKSYDGWRTELWEQTQQYLVTTAEHSISLDQLSDIGVFHKILPEHVPDTKKSYDEHKCVPLNWIAKGSYPGIWCALFSKENTFSFSDGPSNIVQIKFKAEYKLFCSKYDPHVKIWNIWKEAKGQMSNLWENEKNAKGESLAERMDKFGYPNHIDFYKEHRFGAVIGISDYLAAVIVLNECVQEVIF